MTLFRWFMRDRTNSIVSLQLQTLRKVNYLMASWNDIKNDIQELKTEFDKVVQAWFAWKAKYDAKDSVPQEELDKAHADMAAIMADAESKLHADGM